jgi:CubicO group peptidase (beta-lactamase class C family)
MRWIVIPLILIAKLAAAEPPPPMPSCPQIEVQVPRAMAAWQVPGLALGIVRNDRVVYVQTYGVYDAETKAPVTARTMFGIGSITKSLAALSLTIAEAERLVSLDAPVRSVLPYFPGGITLRHLLSHTAGWPRHDALWYIDAYGRSGLVRALAQLPRFAAPGEAYQYNNVTYAAAAHVLERATGTPWDAWVRVRILDPARMRDTVTSVSGFRENHERAIGYFPGETGRVKVQPRDTDPVASAAGLYSNLNDMMRYLQLLTNEGIVADRRILPKDTVQTLLKPAADTGSHSYGLGFNLMDWHGQRLAYHPGVIDGFTARLSILPGLRVGVIALTNLSGRTPVARITSQIALDCMVGAPPTDWIKAFGGGRSAPEPKPAPPEPQPTDRNPEAYAGEYTHPAYGTIEIRPSADGRRIVGRFHWRLLELDYLGNDRWRLARTQWPLREGLVLAFAKLREGRFGQLSTPLADGPTYRHNAGPLEFYRELLL